MKHKWLIFILFSLFASVSSCKYGRPLCSFEKEFLEVSINDTITKEIVRNFYTYRRFKIVKAIQEENKVYDGDGNLILHSKQRFSPKGMRDGYSRVKYKTIHFDKNGKKTSKEIYIRQSSGSYPKRIRQKTVSYLGRFIRDVEKYKR